jgi:pilus assembly protein CpaD
MRIMSTLPASKTARPGPANGPSRHRAQLALLGATALALSACSHGAHPSMQEARFVNYDQRHALQLQQGEASLPLLVGAHARGLTGGDRTALSGFLQSYAARGESGLRVRVPEGSQNAAAAMHALAEIHDVVADAGVNPGHVGVERYHVGNPSAHAPIMVVYDRLEAVTNRCGTWGDTFNPPFVQNDYYNFGCATQANFGAMLDDPRDLVRPRGRGYPEAGRRATVLSQYRQGLPTQTQTTADSGAAVAEVEQ